MRPHLSRFQLQFASIEFKASLGSIVIWNKDCTLVFTMLVAAPILNKRISPLFDVARNLLLVNTENKEKFERCRIYLEELDLAVKSKRIADIGVNVLICGAISKPLEVMLVSAGVRVVPNTCGQAEEVLLAFISGQLAKRSFLMPGCRGQRRRFGIHHRQRSSWQTNEGKKDLVRTGRRNTMPGGDRTGPAGMGPTTGRARGYCNRFAVPGFANGGGRRGNRFGGRSGGWGNRFWYHAAGLSGWQGKAMDQPGSELSAFGQDARTKEELLEGLKAQVAFLEDTLSDIGKQIANLETDMTENSE